MPPVVFEPTISADERPQTYALDRAATGTGSYTADTSTLLSCLDFDDEHKKLPRSGV